MNVKHKNSGKSSSNKQDKDKENVNVPPDTDFNNSSDPLSPNLTKVLQTQAALRKLIATDIEFAQPILQQNGNAVIFPHTINVIQGQAGKHKSRLAENVCAALLRGLQCNNELLKFERTNYDAVHTVVYVDTERNLSDQLPYALQSIQIKAGYKKEDTLPNFQYISLLQINRKERFETLKEYLAYLRKSNNQSLFIVLDVSTDCIEDFNKVDKSMELIDLMNMAINETDVTFLCIIHENPGSEKGRGHFGTELMNKASTVIQVGFEKDANQNETEIVRAKYLKCRSTAKHTPFYFKYCSDTQGLVIASDAEIAAAENNRKRKADIEDIIEHIEMYIGDGTTLSRTALLEKLCTDFDASQKTMEGRIKEIVETKAELTDNEGRTCTLHKETVNKQMIYSLKQSERQ